MNLKGKIRVIEDFPSKGISFKDITTLLKDGQAYKLAINKLADLITDKEIDLIAAPEARGFLIGAPLAYELGVGFVPARKKGKLPAQTIESKYELEYGIDVIEMHADAIQPGQKVVIVDDLLATGGTIISTVKLVEELGGIITSIAFLIELTELNGRANLSDYDIVSLIKY
jgi:adenine phosphoribosyltransferase